MDWKQRKWFDLYFKACEIYDSLDRFQAQHVFGNSAYSQDQRNRDLSDLMDHVRKVHSMAAVFPRTQAITDLFDATATFKDSYKEVESKERLKKISDAVEGLREQAKLWDASVLE
jgi:deoxyribodipyrimidine photolyase